MKTSLVEKIKLGALSIDGELLSFPKRPWGYEGTHAPRQGDMPGYYAGAIEIVESANMNSLISWIPVEHGGKELLIADRNLLVDISWDQLDKQGLIFGREVTLGSKRYKLRVLTGGEEPFDGDGDLGGSPQTNEWDTFISNLLNYENLPRLTEEDIGEYVSEESFEGAHNDFWNWAYTFSWCQEAYRGQGTYRVIRGHYSARYLYWGTSSYRTARNGWRPVLEVLESETLISDEDVKGKLKDLSDDGLKELIVFAEEELGRRKTDYRITEWIENTFEAMKSDFKSEINNILSEK